MNRQAIIAVILFLLLAAPALAVSTLPTNLTAYWNFDNSSYNDALLVANVSNIKSGYTASNCKINGCAIFSSNMTGTTENLITVPAMNNASNGTVNFWSRYTGIAVLDGHVLAGFEGAGVVMRLMFPKTANYVTDWDLAGVDWYHVNTTHAAIVGGVGMWTWTWNQSGRGMWYNGTLLARYNTTARWLANNSVNLGHNTKGGDEFAGTVDEMGMWSRTLSTEEIAELYNGGAGNPYSNFSSVYVPPVVVLQTPDNNDHDRNATFTYGLTTMTPANCSLLLNGTVNMTNTSLNDGTHTFTPTLPDSTYNWTVTCSDGTTWINSTNRTMFIDTTAPAWSFLAGNFFSAANTTIINAANQTNVNLSVRATDMNLFSVNATILNGSATIMFATGNTALNTTLENLTNTTTLTAWANGNYTVNLYAEDDHTAKAIPNYNYTIVPGGVNVNLPDGTTLGLSIVDLAKLNSFTLQKGSDRYAFVLGLKTGTASLTFRVNSTRPLTRRSRYSFPSFVTGRHWLDFNSTTPITYAVTALPVSGGRYQYVIGLNFTSTTGLTLNSLGGLNTVNETYAFKVARSPTFLNQTPANLTSANAVGADLTQWWNVTTGASATLYHMTVNSSADPTFSVNGTGSTGWLTHAGTTTAGNFTATLDDDEVYPATYNFEEEDYETQPRASVNVGTLSSRWLRQSFLSVVNDTSYNFLEVMVNKTANNTAQLEVYYCNSTYTTGSPTTSPYCGPMSAVSYNTTNYPATPGNHTHALDVTLTVVTIPLNTTSKAISGIKVTSTSYILLRGGHDWLASFVPNVTRAASFADSTNNGNTWNSITGTLEAHIHQFHTTETFYTRVCALYDATEYCGNVHTDTVELGGIPPSAPVVTLPAESPLYTPVSIAWSQSYSPLGYNVTYAIYLRNETNNAIIDTVLTNTSILSTSWGTTRTGTNLTIRVVATDQTGLTAHDDSEVFSLLESANITGCVNLTTSGNYSFTTSIQANASPCIRIAVDTVGIDCAFNTLNVTGIGISFDAGVSGVLIENCIFRDGYIGVGANTTRANVSDVTFSADYFYNQTLAGVRIQGSGAVLVVDSYFNSTNALLLGTNDTIISGNVFDSSPLWLNDTVYTALINFTVYNNQLRSCNASIENSGPSTISFSITPIAGTPIKGGLLSVGGNYWEDANGTGYSETCADGDADGFCDVAYSVFAGLASDDYPLAPLVGSIDCQVEEHPSTWGDTGAVCTLSGVTGKTFQCFGLTKDSTGNLLDMMPRPEFIPEYGMTAGFTTGPAGGATQSVRVLFSSKRLKAGLPAVYQVKCVDQAGAAQYFAHALAPEDKAFGTAAADIAYTAGPNTPYIILGVGLVIVFFFVIFGIAHIARGGL